MGECAVVLDAIGKVSTSLTKFLRDPQYKLDGDFSGFKGWFYRKYILPRYPFPSQQHVLALTFSFVMDVFVGLLLVLSMGAVGFYLFEKDEQQLTMIDCYYFAMVTATTVGFGDILPLTDWGKLFVSFYVIIGVGYVGIVLGEYNDFQNKVINIKKLVKAECLGDYSAGLDFLLRLKPKITDAEFYLYALLNMDLLDSQTLAYIDVAVWSRLNPQQDGVSQYITRENLTQAQTKHEPGSLMMKMPYEVREQYVNTSTWNLESVIGGEEYIQAGKRTGFLNRQKTSQLSKNSTIDKKLHN